VEDVPSGNVARCSPLHLHVCCTWGFALSRSKTTSRNKISIFRPHQIFTTLLAQSIFHLNDSYIKYWLFIKKETTF